MAACLLARRSAGTAGSLSLGSPGMVGINFDADVLLVDRDLVPVGSVIKVLQALQNQGVTIKSVQQEPLRQSESQIGSVVVGTEPVFQKRPAPGHLTAAAAEGRGFLECRHERPGVVPRGRQPSRIRVQNLYWGKASAPIHRMT